MKKLYIAVISVFLLFITCFGILTFALPRKDFSENENRYLAEKPELSLSGIRKGSFQNELTEYINDSFPLRNQWLSLSAKLKRFEGRKDIGGAYLGKNGFYFEKVMQSDIDMQRFEKNLSYIEKFCGAIGTDNPVFMLVPPSSAVLGDYLPDYAEVYDAQSAARFAEEKLSCCKFTDLCTLFANYEAPEQLYYKTDHHWTSRGAYEAYCLYAQQMDFDAAPYPKTDIFADDFLGTLYSKVLDSSAEPDTIEIISDLPDVTVSGGTNVIYATEYADKKDKYRVFFGGNFGSVTIKTNADNDKTLLVIKDSYANCFVPFLLNDYQKIIMLDLRFFNGSAKMLAASENVTDVLFLFGIHDFAAEESIVKLLM